MYQTLLNINTVFESENQIRRTRNSSHKFSSISSAPISLSTVAASLFKSASIRPPFTSNASMFACAMPSCFDAIPSTRIEISNDSIALLLTVLPANSSGVIDHTVDLVMGRADKGSIQKQSPQPPMFAASLLSQFPIPLSPSASYYACWTKYQVSLTEFLQCSWSQVLLTIG